MKPDTNGSGYLLVLSKVIQLVVGFASIRILTELLSPEELGRYYLVLSWIALFGFSLLNPIGQFFNRNLNFWSNDGFIKEPFWAAVIIRFLCIIALAFLFVMLMFLMPHVSTINFSIDVTLFSLVITMLLAGTLQAVLAMFNTIGDRKVFFTYTLLFPVSSLGMSTILILIFGSEHIYWFAGQAIVQLFLLLSVLVFNIRSLAPYPIGVLGFTKSLNVDDVLAFCIPVAFVLFLQWLQTKSYRFFVETEFSIDVVAYLSVSLAVSYALFSSLENLMNQLVNPFYFREIAKNKVNIGSIWDRTASIYMPMYILLLLIILAFSDVIVLALVSDEYQNISVFVRIGALIEFFRVVSNVLVIASHGANNTKLLILPYSIGAAVFMMMMVMMTIFDNLYFVLLALLCSNLVLVIFLGFKLKGAVKIDYSKKKVIGFSVFFVPVVMLFSFLSSYGWQFEILAMFLSGTTGLFIALVKTDLKKILL